MKKILIVDDEPEVIELVSTRLKEHDFDVISAGSARQGITKAEVETPDLILMDIMMPHIPGGDAVRELRANQKTCDIPVVFLTAVANSEDYARKGTERINVGGVAYDAIGKPFRPETLLKMVRKYLS